MDIVNMIGWYGTIAILVGYFLISYDIIKNGYLYQLINVTGAASMSYIAFSKDATPIAVLNVAFLTIGTVAILKMMWRDMLVDLWDVIVEKCNENTKRNTSRR